VFWAKDLGPVPSVWSVHGAASEDPRTRGDAASGEREGRGAKYLLTILSDSIMKLVHLSCPTLSNPSSIAERGSLFASGRSRAIVLFLQGGVPPAHTPPCKIRHIYTVYRIVAKRETHMWPNILQHRPVRSTHDLCLLITMADTQPSTHHSMAFASGQNGGVKNTLPPTL
jgi:hypothetical protein